MRDQTTHTPTTKGSNLLPACRLYRKTNAQGVPYLMGRLGGLRVLILSKWAGEEGEHTHNLLLAEATQRDQKDGAR